MSVAGGGGIFVSYRRQESSHLAGRLADHLGDRFGEEQVFIDVDTIEPGMDFTEEISQAVAACQVLLTIIGPAWLTATDGQDRRRLDDTDDIVRLEVETALARGVRVIPVLTEGAVMPDQHDLPDSLSNLARRNAITIRHESFRSDAGRLITAIERALAAPGTSVASSSPGAHGARSSAHAGGEIARTVPRHAGNDAAWATRLLAETEDIANSITDAYPKSNALSGIAQAVASTDPGRADRLIADVERTASTITDPLSKGGVLSGVAQALAATNPDRAERIADSIAGPISKSTALNGIAMTLVASDPDRAARLFADAARIASSNTRQFSKAGALSGVAQALAASDPDRAAQLFADAIDAASAITDESSKAKALSVVVKGLAATF